MHAHAGPLPSLRMQGTIERAWERLNVQDPEGAKAILRQALKKLPGYAPAHKLMGMIHSGHNEDILAYEALDRATHCDPTDAEGWFMLGNAAMILRRNEDGVRAYSQCIKLSPIATSAHDGRAKCLISLGRRDEAITTYESSVTITPLDENVWGRYSTALLVIGMVHESVAILRRGMDALAQRGGPGSSPLLIEQMCYAMNFLNDADPAEHKAAHVALGKIWSAKATRREPSFARTNADPERLIRVAFVSGDFCGHACAWFLEGPLAALRTISSATRIQTYLYSTLDRDDEITERFKPLGVWRPCVHMEDDQLAHAFADDEIDVVIECAGWTEGSRLKALVPRVAPVQMTYLGYPNTTGMPSIDARIVDWDTDPAGAEFACTERLIRLDRCFICFRPHDHSPDVGITNAMRDASAPIVFASFNRATKLSDECVVMWSKVLHEVSAKRGLPDSRLLMKSAIVSDETRRDASARFNALGIDPSRIDIVPYTKDHVEHLAMYRDVDIALDTFPYHGTTTTCEAVWMGVPVITRAGSTHRSRVGVSILNTLGLPELVTNSDEGFVAAAVSLANDRSRLLALRTTLRERMRTSPLCDANAHATALVGAIRFAWRNWCSAKAASAHNDKAGA